MQGGTLNRRRLLLSALTVLGAALPWPASSHAFVACSYSSGELTVDLTADDDSVTLTRFRDQIVVLTGSSVSILGDDYDEYDDYYGEETQIAIPCSGGTPTPTNTDHVSVAQSPTAEFGAVTVDQSNGPFAPGATPESDGTSEIEFGFNLPGRLSSVGIKGTEAGESILVGMLPSGAAGVNLNAGAEAASADADIEAAGTRYVIVNAEPGDDVVTGMGGPGLSGPLTSGFLIASGGAGNDLLQAGPLGAGLEGDEGSNTLIGSPHKDFLDAEGGKDKAFAGKGSDRIDALDRKKDFISCGAGKRDFVVNDFIDRALHCERGRRIRLRKHHPPRPDAVASAAKFLRSR
jgi:Ca2+-binding RTX toxin-like protein